MLNVIEEMSGYTGDTGNYVFALRMSGNVPDPGEYRARLFFRYDGMNDLTSATGTGVYAVPSNPCDTVTYDDWNGVFRRPYNDTTGSTHDSSFNLEVVCEFSGDTYEHSLEFMDSSGRTVRLSGESKLNGTFSGGNIPANVLIERKLPPVSIESAEYDPVTGTVTVVTRGNHGFADGDAVTMSGFPRTDHSCGVAGERFNGTYRVSVTADDSFTYRTRFFTGFGGQTTKYENCELAVATKWITCEYLVDKTAIAGMSEAVVIWPAHTFKNGDRITLCRGGSTVVTNAVIDIRPANGGASNAFVCRSRNIALGLDIDSIAYAPRTPAKDVPANYGPYPEREPPVSTKKLLRRTLKAPAGNATPEPSVNNGSTIENEAVILYPSLYGAFDLANPDKGGGVVTNTIAVCDGKFAVIKFNPPVAAEGGTGRKFLVEILVKASTEVLTDICMSPLADSFWDTGDSAIAVGKKISAIPLARMPIRSDEGDEQTCDYESQARVFTFEVPSSTSEKWCATGRPVSLAFTLYGRTGAEVLLGAEGPGTPCFRITYAAGEDSGEFVPIPIKVMPDVISPGDVVSVMSMNSASFDFLAGNMRVRLGNEDDPAKWVPVRTNDGSTLTFEMPRGYGGNISLTVMKKPTNSDWVPGVAEPCSETATVNALVVVPRVVKLNDRMKPGVIDANVSRSASYNRDFGYKGFTEITDENSMIQNLYSCLLTRKGERLFNPEFGTNIEERIFSLRAGGYQNDILQECFAAIQEYEPRIRLVYEQCSVEDVGPNGIYLILGVIVPAGEVQTITIPFKNRGRVV